MNPIRTTVLLSGSGSTLQNLIDRRAQENLPVEITRVISSRPDSYGLKRAEQHDIPTSVVQRKAYSDWNAFNDSLTRAIRDESPQLVVLAGFMSLFWPGDDYVGKIINVHPSLIPAFCGKGMYGHHVHRAVIAMGVKLTGCTVHFVDNEYDHGPIILQKSLPVLDDDTPETLAGRVQALEREALPEAIHLYAHQRLKIVGNRVHILPSAPSV